MDAERAASRQRPLESEAFAAVSLMCCSLSMTSAPTAVDLNIRQSKRHRLRLCVENPEAALAPRWRDARLHLWQAIRVRVESGAVRG